MGIKNEVLYYTIVKKDDILFADGCSMHEKARYLLKWMLDYLGMEFCDIGISDYGKPYFKSGDIRFNYSHSNNYIACAVSFFEVGVDIEDTGRKISDRVSNRYLDGERDIKKRLEKWVRKEAYGKLKGLGLLIDFSKINLDEVCNKNIFINNEHYVCSIYSDYSGVIFKEIKFSEK